MVRALTVAELRDLLAELPGHLPVLGTGSRSSSFMPLLPPQQVNVRLAEDIELDPFQRDDAQGTAAVILSPYRLP